METGEQPSLSSGFSDALSVFLLLPGLLAAAGARQCGGLIMYVYYWRTFRKAVSGGRWGKGRTCVFLCFMYRRRGRRYIGYRAPRVSQGVIITPKP